MVKMISLIAICFSFIFGEVIEYFYNKSQKNKVSQGKHYQAEKQHSQTRSQAQ